MIRIKVGKEEKMLKFDNYYDFYSFFKKHNLQKKPLKEIARVFFREEEYAMFFEMIFNLDIEKHFLDFKPLLFENAGKSFVFLNYAMRYHLNEIAMFLLDIQEEINEQDSGKSTLLHYAVFWGNFEVAQELIRRGINKDIQNVCKFTAYKMAIDFRNEKMKELLKN